MRVLSYLYNWLIVKNDVTDLPSHSIKDKLSTISRGGEILKNKDTPLARLLGNGKYYNYCSMKERKQLSRSLIRTPNAQYSREHLLNKLN